MRGKRRDRLYLRFGEKRPVKLRRRKLSDRSAKIVPVEDAQLSGYRIGKRLLFPTSPLSQLEKRRPLGTQND